MARTAAEAAKHRLQKGKLLLLFLFLLCLNMVHCYTKARSLPGFTGSLPFDLETGYIGVDGSEADDVQLYYYFVKSERNPSDDPLRLWITGGPGCSALTGLIYEIGPLNFKVVEYNGTLPTLILNPNSWTKWLTDHPEFLSNPVYIAGDSYSGMTVPIIALDISNGNKAGYDPGINLKGYVLSNPVTDRKFDESSKISYACGMGLISNELYESTKKRCGEEYVNVDPSNLECVKALQAVSEDLKLHISWCLNALMHPQSHKRLLDRDNHSKIIQEILSFHHLLIPDMSVNPCLYALLLLGK